MTNTTPEPQSEPKTVPHLVRVGGAESPQIEPQIEPPIEPAAAELPEEVEVLARFRERGGVERLHLVGTVHRADWFKVRAEMSGLFTDNGQRIIRRKTAKPIEIIDIDQEAYGIALRDLTRRSPKEGLKIGDVFPSVQDASIALGLAPLSLSVTMTQARKYAQKHWVTVRGVTVRHFKGD